MPPYAERASAVLRRISSLANPVGAEIGVFSGSMSQELLKRNTSLRLLMVDNWAPGNLQPEAYKQTNDFHSNKSLHEQNRYKRSAVDQTRIYGARRNILDMTSVEAAKLQDPASLDFVFLDADHSYPAVQLDIQMWWPIVRPGGWLSGHDYTDTRKGIDADHQFGVGPAVDEFVEANQLVLELDVNTTWFVRKPA